MSPPKPDAFRPVALGLAGGLVLGSGFLVVKALGLVNADCPPGVGGEECMLELTAGKELSTLFLLSALGLLLVGAGIFLASRTRKESST